MSALLKDRVWVMLSEVAKRGVYPLHGSRLGIFRIPAEITERSDINAIINSLKVPASRSIRMQIESMLQTDGQKLVLMQ